MFLKGAVRVPLRVPLSVPNLFLTTGWELGPFAMHAKRGQSILSTDTGTCKSRSRFTTCMKPFQQHPSISEQELRRCELLVYK